VEILGTATQEGLAVIRAPNAVNQEMSAVKARINPNQGAVMRTISLIRWERDVYQSMPLFVLMERATAQRNLNLVKMDIAFTIADEFFGIFTN
jgi:hypothetical protein